MRHTDSFFAAAAGPSLSAFLAAEVVLPGPSPTAIKGE